jgi:hypothetical protein
MWREVTQIPSDSNPKKYYIIKINDKGELGCDCPAWRFNRERKCKHTAVALLTCANEITEMRKEEEY